VVVAGGVMNAKVRLFKAGLERQPVEPAVAASNSSRVEVLVANRAMPGNVFMIWLVQ
jgi:hypothetical protein